MAYCYELHKQWAVRLKLNNDLLFLQLLFVLCLSHQFPLHRLMHIVKHNFSCQNAILFWWMMARTSTSFFSRILLKFFPHLRVRREGGYSLTPAHHIGSLRRHNRQITCPITLLITPYLKDSAPNDLGSHAANNPFSGIVRPRFAHSEWGGFCLVWGIITHCVPLGTLFGFPYLYNWGHTSPGSLGHLSFTVIYSVDGWVVEWSMGGTFVGKQKHCLFI